MSDARLSVAGMLIVAFMMASFVSFLVAPFVAWRKGYAPYYWLFA